MGYKLQNVYLDAYKNTIVSHNYLYRKTKLIGYMLMVVTYIITYCLLYFTDLHLERWNKLVICGGASLILFHIIYFIFYRSSSWKMKQTGYQLGVLHWYYYIFFIILQQIFILKDETNWLSVGGASLIFVSAAGVACRRLVDEIQSGKQ